MTSLSVLDEASILETLRDLIRINSVNPNYRGGVPECELAAFIEQFFKMRGIETWRQPVLPNRYNVLARLPGRNSGRRVVLEAHMDTVSVDRMTIDPFEPVTVDRRMHGRGSCDTKGGMAAMMHAVASVAEQRVTPPCDLLFAATIDEEYSYRGVAALCRGTPIPNGDRCQHGNEVKCFAADAAIVAEPTSLNMVVASKGLVRLKIETIGKAAHSAKPHLGLNAIEQMSVVIQAIQKDTQRLRQFEHPLLGSATCNIGVIQGGTQINLVPSSCEIEVDRRLLPGENASDVIDHYQVLLTALAEKHSDLQFVIHPPLLTDVPLETDAESPPVECMARILEDMQLDPTPRGVPYCSDASKFGALGIPSMIFGPGSIDQAHAADEFVDCDQVHAAAQIYRRFMMEFGA